MRIEGNPRVQRRGKWRLQDYRAKLLRQTTRDFTRLIEGRSQKAIDFPTMSDREEMDLVLLQVECVNDSIVAHSQTEPL